jgi:hypothetical protein
MRQVPQFRALKFRATASPIRASAAIIRCRLSETSGILRLEEISLKRVQRRRESERDGLAAAYRPLTENYVALEFKAQSV